jgi:hypothetical protein
MIYTLLCEVDSNDIPRQLLLFPEMGCYLKNHSLTFSAHSLFVKITRERIISYSAAFLKCYAPTWLIPLASSLCIIKHW